MTPRFRVTGGRFRAGEIPLSCAKVFSTDVVLVGPDGALPIIPIYWYTYVQQERPSVQDTWNLNLLDQTDLTKVQVVDK